jgi:hypothetical protein
MHGFVNGKPREEDEGTLLHRLQHVARHVLPSRLELFALR